MTEEHTTPSKLIFTEFDKHERMQALNSMAHLFDTPEYWRILGRIWGHNESLFQETSIIPHLWNGCGIHSIEYRHYSMSTEDKKSLSKMPDEVTVWRGGFEGNLWGWSWTTDRNTALFFTKRFIPDSRPIIAEARISKDTILAYLSDSSESEIVVDPSDVFNLTIEELPEQKKDAASYLYFLAQSGNLTVKDDPDTKAKLIAMSGMEEDTISRHYEQRINDLEYYSLVDRAQKVRDEHEAIINAIYEYKESNTPGPGR